MLTLTQTYTHVRVTQICARPDTSLYTACLTHHNMFPSDTIWMLVSAEVYPALLAHHTHIQTLKVHTDPYGIVAAIRAVVTETICVSRPRVLYTLRSKDTRLTGVSVWQACLVADLERVMDGYQSLLRNCQADPG